LAREGNKYLNLKEPWKTVKSNVNDAKTTLFVAAQLVKTIAILLVPFIPSSAKKVLEYLNIEKFSWSYLTEVEIPPGHLIKKPEPIFQKIADEKIEEILESMKTENK
jgi:methionyl-tRNA synthetase